MRIFCFVVVLLGGLLAGCYGYYQWDKARNRGMEFGYYGEFNRVSNALASIRGVVIRKHAHNLDATLEQMVFEITFEDKPVRLYLGGGHPIRKMSRDDAVPALKQWIKAELRGIQVKP